MSIYKHAKDYLKRNLISCLPIPFVVVFCYWLGLPNDIIITIAFVVSAITLEIALYFERMQYVR